MSARFRLSPPDMRAAVALFAAAGLACAAAAYTHVRWQDTVGSIDAARTSLAALRAREVALDSEQARLGRLDAAVARLRERGFLTDRARSRWVEAVRAAKQTSGLEGVEYQAIDERTVNFAPADDAVGSGLTEYLVRVQAPVLHEGHLLGFLDALRTRPAGILRLHACTLERPRAAPAAVLPMHLQASCDVAWVTAAPVREAAPK
jgi:hypothetical protein